MVTQPEPHRAPHISHLAFETAEFRHAEECLQAIRQRIDAGWVLVDVRGPDHGPYAVVFRRGDAT